MFKLNKVIEDKISIEVESLEPINYLKWSPKDVEIEDSGEKIFLSDVAFFLHPVIFFKLFLMSSKFMIFPLNLKMKI
jgi:hypothetical protein